MATLNELNATIILYMNGNAIKRIPYNFLLGGDPLTNIAPLFFTNSTNTYTEIGLEWKGKVILRVDLTDPMLSDYVDSSFFQFTPPN